MRVPPRDGAGYLLTRPSSSTNAAAGFARRQPPGECRAELGVVPWRRALRHADIPRYTSTTAPTTCRARYSHQLARNSTVRPAPGPAPSRRRRSRCRPRRPARGAPVTHRPVQEQHRGRPRQRGHGQAGRQERGQHREHVPEDLTHPPIAAPADRSTQSIFTAGNAGELLGRAQFQPGRRGQGGTEICGSGAVACPGLLGQIETDGTWFRLSLQVQAVDTRRHPP